MIEILFIVICGYNLILGILQFVVEAELKSEGRKVSLNRKYFAFELRSEYMKMSEAKRKKLSEEYKIWTIMSKGNYILIIISVLIIIIFN